MNSIVVIALGGNALLLRGQPASAASQRLNIRRAAEAIAPLLSRYRVVITHGNGPQVGLLAVQSGKSDWPLDVLGAETEGMIGYVIEQELLNVCPDRQFATLLSQVLIALDDPAFSEPTKPIGAIHADPAAMQAQGWPFVADGNGWRRVVASPIPTAVVSVRAISVLIEAGITVICLGGGGIPVGRQDDGRLCGVEAVIDKDAASALLALELGADALIMLTDVAGVMTDFGTPNAACIQTTTPAALELMSFQPGTMGPKVAAAAAMARDGGIAMIGALGELQALVDRTSGTWVVPDGTGGRP